MSETVVIIGGTCGTGKTTIGEEIAAHFGTAFVEGDDVHPKENIEKMAQGIPLQDEDRWGWLEQLSKLSSEAAANNKNHIAVAACSSLKKAYRHKIATTSTHTRFLYVFLYTSKEELIKRTQQRQNHYMKSSMVDSQFAALELPIQTEEPNTVVIDVTGKTVQEIVDLGIQFVESSL